MWQKIKSVFILPYPEAERDQVETLLARRVYWNRQLLYFGVAFMQLSLLITFALRPGGLFLHARRTGYVCMYFILLVCSLSSSILLARLRDHSPRSQEILQNIYAALVCLWSCGIAVLDRMGGGGITVFCYMMPALAALCVLKWNSALIIMGGSWLLLNTVLLLMPGGFDELFNNAMNSMCAVTLSVLIANQLYRAYSHALYQTLLVQRLAITDPLTCLYNRRYLDECIPEILDRPDSQGKMVVALLMDIDHFKDFNDRYGHRAGDECLKTLAEALLELGDSREAHVVRYGGEELFMLWLDSDPSKAVQTAETLRNSIAHRQIFHEGKPLGPVTVSIGLTIESLETNLSIDSLIQHADAALYQAKTEGRNRVVLYCESA